MVKAILGFILLTFVVFLGYFFTAKGSLEDDIAIRKYVESRGAAPLPKSWKRKLGKGI